jgi:hypothetical protein
LSKYAPGNANEAQEIVERVVPRLQHANASVVLSAVRVLMIYLPLLGGGEHEKTVVRKLAPPLGIYFRFFIYSHFTERGGRDSVCRIEEHQSDSTKET